MARLTLALLFGCLLLVAAPVARAEDGGDAPDDPDTVVLTLSNFDEVIGSSKYALVEFYAPWCGHCKSLAPHYAKAATALKSSHPDVVVAKLDADAHKELGSRFGVSGFPTLKWFVDGEVAMDYGGGRDADGIISWIKKKIGPVAATVESAETLTALEADNEVLVLAYYKALEGDAYSAFAAVAAKTEDVGFAQTTDAAVAAAAGLTSEGVVVIKTFKGEERETAVAAAAASLSEFITAEKMPLTIEFTSGNTNKIFQSGIPKQIIYWAGPDDHKPESVGLKVLRAVAASYKGKLVFVTSSIEGDGEPITKFFGLSGTAPVVLGFHMEANKKYRMAGALTVEALTAFVDSLLDGTAQPDFKSAEIPASPLEDGVTVVVGKSFEDIVLDAAKDVLLEVYAPWCGHCKTLAPIYAKLAKRFKSVDSVVIAKMDGTENEHDKVEAKGYPTLLFYPAGSKDKQPIVVDGERSLAALTKFIKAHAVNKYELPKKSKAAESEDGKDEL